MGGAEEGPSEARTEPLLLRVVKGDPTPEELAALVGVIASLGGAAEPAPRPTPEWSAPHRKLRVTFPAGLGGWRSSGLPK